MTHVGSPDEYRLTNTAGCWFRRRGDDSVGHLPATANEPDGEQPAGPERQNRARLGNGSHLILAAAEAQELSADPEPVELDILEEPGVAVLAEGEVREDDLSTLRAPTVDGELAANVVE